MKKLICKIFNCRYRYYFSVSNGYDKRQDIRVCRCCGKSQHYKQIIGLKGDFFDWSTMIEFTDKGAKSYWEHLI